MKIQLVISAIAVMVVTMMNAEAADVVIACPQTTAYQLNLVIPTDSAGVKWSQNGLLTFNRLYVASYEPGILHCLYNNVSPFTTTADENLVGFTRSLPDGVTCPMDTVIQSAQIHCSK